MNTMTTASAPTPAPWLPSGRPFTADDLTAQPDDGNRYELIDGALLVTPSPAMRHQRGVSRLNVVLSQSCPAGSEVFVAPFDVRLADDTVIQPDVIVARRSDLTEADLPAAPLLAVEVLSPSTRGIDLLLKRDRLERADCPSYWVLDPLVGRLIAWELDETGRYVEVADVSGETTWHASRPFAVDVTPARLVD